MKCLVLDKLESQFEKLVENAYLGGKIMRLCQDNYGCLPPKSALTGYLLGNLSEKTSILNCLKDCAIKKKFVSKAIDISSEIIISDTFNMHCDNRERKVVLSFTLECVTTIRTPFGKEVYREAAPSRDCAFGGATWCNCCQA